MVDKEQPAKAKTHRSPNYPGVNLKFATERAQRLWHEQQHHPASRDAVMQNLGYTPKSGAGSVTYGAMKRFGLVADGDRGVALSPLGLAVVRGEEDGQRDYEALRLAALGPAVHAQMWERYGANLPGDVTLQFELAEMGFTRKGAADFVAQWKQTMEFARLADSPDAVPVDEDDDDESEMKAASEAALRPRSAAFPAPAAPGAGQGTLTVPVMGGGWATLHAPIPMTETAWDHLMLVLNALKPAAISSPGGDEPEAPADLPSTD
jgi:hypothetical protein